LAPADRNRSGEPNRLDDISLKTISRPDVEKELVVTVRDLLPGELGYATFMAVFSTCAATFWYRSATSGQANDPKGSLLANVAAALWAATGAFLVGTQFFGERPNAFGAIQDYIAVFFEALTAYVAFHAFKASVKSEAWRRPIE
jgi:hypothetical protein